MLNRIILASLFCLAIAGWGLANQRTVPEQRNDRYVYLSEISQKELQDMLNEPNEQDILVCPKGTQLPVDFSFKGDLIELNAPVHSLYKLVMKQTFYLRLRNEQVLISLDGFRWKSLEELLTGEISSTLTHKLGTPRLELSGEAHMRSSNGEDTSNNAS